MTRDEFQFNWVVTRGWVDTNTINTLLSAIKTTRNEDLCWILAQQGYITPFQQDELARATSTMEWSFVDESAPVVDSTQALENAFGYNGENTMFVELPANLLQELQVKLAAGLHEAEQSGCWLLQSGQHPLPHYQNRQVPPDDAPTVQVNIRDPKIASLRQPADKRRTTTGALALRALSAQIVEEEPPTDKIDRPNLGISQRASSTLPAVQINQTRAKLTDFLESTEENRGPLQQSTSLERIAFANYQIVSKISQGSMGAVFKARHKDLQTLVALKIMLGEKPKAADEARFIREARVLAQLSHPHILRSTYFGRDDGIPFLVMDFVEGPNLFSIVNTALTNTRVPPEPEWVVRTLEPIAKALSYCHTRGVIHRDVKPQNILLENHTERPILIDFGLARGDPTRAQLEISVSASSDSSGVYGTPLFMSPEQAYPENFGHTGLGSDVWSFGATLFYCLTGLAPYQESTLAGIFEAILTKTPPRVHWLNPEVPYWLDQIVDDCLQKQHDKRATMPEIAKRLRDGLRTFSSAKANVLETPGQLLKASLGLLRLSFLKAIGFSKDQEIRLEQRRSEEL